MNVFTFLFTEIRKITGVKKILFIAMLINLPLPQIFIPYATQATTMILLMLFLFNYQPSKRVINGKHQSNLVFFGYPITFSVVVILTIVLQLFWIPFLTQLLTIALLSLLYLTTKSN